MVYRIATVSFLNTVPLVASLNNNPDFEVEVLYALPSRLAPYLANGKADVALLPVVEVFQRKSSGLLSGAGIACRGKVDSVKLFSQGDLSSLVRVYVDRGSRTSVALLRVLFEELFGRNPEFIEVVPRLGKIPDDNEGVLIIGDRCFEFERSLKSDWPENLTSHDLGEIWFDLTGLPFVFAAWAGAPNLKNRIGESGVSRLADILNGARDYGISNLDKLAKSESESGRCGWGGEATEEEIYYYFKNSLHYVIGPEERAGMEKFRELCIKHGIVPGGESF